MRGANRITLALGVILCVAFAGVGWAAVKTDKDTIALWPFEEGTGRFSADVVAKVRGALHGGCTWDEGKFGRALHFDGRTGKFAVAASETFTIGTGEGLTVELWVKVAAEGIKRTQQILHGLPERGQARLQLEMRPGTGVVWFALGNDVVRNAKKNIADGMWHHVAGVRDVKHGLLVLYIDGVADGSAACDVKKDLAIPFRFVVGGETAGGTVARAEECLKGAVDELRFSRTGRLSVPPPKTTKPEKGPPTETLPPLIKVKIRLKEFTNSLGMKFVAIPAGDFDMGGNAFNNQPVRRVRITRPFYIGVHEVTQSQFKRIMRFNPSTFSYKSPKHPVECVSWFEAVEFCKRLSGKEGKTYRLPTEAEWEYACRAGTKTTYFFGDEPAKLPEYAWGRGKHVMNARRPGAVGTRKPNPWDLYDMLGNVSEWCADWYEPLYYRAAAAADPQGPSRSYIVEGRGARVIRGGNWCGWIGSVPRPKYTCAFRDYVAADAKNRKVGFRVVCEIR